MKQKSEIRSQWSVSRLLVFTRTGLQASFPPLSTDSLITDY